MVSGPAEVERRVREGLYSSMMMGGAGVCCDLMRVDLEPVSMASVLFTLQTQQNHCQKRMTWQRGLI